MESTSLASANSFGYIPPTEQRYGLSFFQDLTAERIQQIEFSPAEKSLIEKLLRKKMSLILAIKPNKSRKSFELYEAARGIDYPSIQRKVEKENGIDGRHPSLELIKSSTSLDWNDAIGFINDFQSGDYNDSTLTLIHFRADGAMITLGCAKYEISTPSIPSEPNRKVREILDA